MDTNAYIKFEREDNKTFVIGRNHAWRFKKNGLEGFGELNNELNYIDNGVFDGGFITNTRIGKIDRTIQASYIKPSENDIARRRALSFFNAKSKYKVFVYYNETIKWQEATILKLNISTSPDVTDLMSLTVTLEFPNPYWKSYDNYGKDIASIEGKAGFPYICTATTGFSCGVYNFAEEVELSNDGDVETYCTAVFKASGSVTNPSLKIGDDYVKVIGTMAKGDEISMDFTQLPPRVEKNGSNFIGHCDRTSSFDSMKIPVGKSIIKYEAEAGSDKLSVSIYYNKLYSLI